MTFRHAARSIALVALCGWTFAAGSNAQERRLERASSGPERRLALVVGNDAYSTAPLRRAVSDARSMARVLEDDLGFAVSLVTDARQDTFESRIDTFIAQLQPGDVALFFYAGHGLEIRGENYLLPVDFIAPEQEVQVKRRSVSAAEVLERMGERGARVRLMVLDACRDNPFRGTRSAAGGLGALQAQGALVAFASAPGQTASDNGLFTAELLTALREPGLSLPEVFRRVRQRVNTSSGGRQFPWVSDGLIGDVVLRPGARQPGEPAVNAASREDQLWASIKDIRDAAVFEDYLSRVGRNELPGLYTAAATARIQEIRATTTRPTTVSSQSVRIVPIEFDDKKPIEASGIVTKVVWEPRVFVNMDVSTPGAVTNWVFDFGTGYSDQMKAALQVGAGIYVSGYQSQNGGPSGRAFLFEAGCGGGAGCVEFFVGPKE